jgi:hypothetical protein
MGLCILIFTFLDSSREDKRLYTEWQQALPEFNLLLISSWIRFCFLYSFQNIWKWLINLFNNPNPVYSHTYYMKIYWYAYYRCGHMLTTARVPCATFGRLCSFHLHILYSPHVPGFEAIAVVTTSSAVFWVRFIAWLTLQPWRSRRYVSLKCQPLSELHGATRRKKKKRMSSSSDRWSVVVRLTNEPGSSREEFVVDKVVLGQVFSEYFGLLFQSSFHQFLHNHHHLSSGAGTRDQ